MISRDKLQDYMVKFLPTQLLLLWYLLRKLNPGKFTEKRKSERRICTSIETDGRYHFLHQVKEFQGHELKFFQMPTGFFQKLYFQYMGHLLNPNPKHNCDLYVEKNDKFYRDMEKYRKRLGKLIGFMKWLMKPNLFVSASIGDARWREMVKVSYKAVGVPWMVTEREAVVAPCIFDRNVPFVQEAFEPDCDHMSVANETHYKYWRKMGFSEDMVTLTGELKSDYWFHPYQVYRDDEIPGFNSEKINILYFAFGKNNYIKPNIFPNIKDNWEYLQSEHLEVIREIANSRNDVQFIIKGGHAGDLNALFKQCDKELKEKRFLLLDAKYKAIDMILKSNIIIGFQTTAVIESMLTEKPIIYGGWGEFHEMMYPELLPLKNGDVITPNSKDDFKNHIINLIEAKSFAPDKEKRKRFIADYFYEANGKCHERVLEVMMKVIDNKSSN